ncbi:LLM class flavin-dependent oxidoreductase [Olivibacter sp. 47]|uniref:LLM class flavin-dependent oxidoreductase n=1 Tax=Olivibacter sp. 47 TaxID=3056486 RepID=UPI0025A4185E|nr:LLM class flavin-dependent oxidoreductase [Olivibacter sp. 47]MDM8173644.1 LLM class flavin-dependent oxidoreductase [Olivibacter sp. 47]
MVNLSLLDFGNIYPPEVYAHDVINHLLENIQVFERLGYKRYWMSEHLADNVAWASPEHLIPLLAGYTDEIKIGVAGVLLKYHMPIRVAQAFTLISSLYPERIDLGLAKGDIQDIYLKPFANLDRHPKEDYFFDQVDELMGFMRNNLGDTKYKNIQIQPYATKGPDYWLLGSSPNLLQSAVKYKTNFCLSLFHTDRRLKDISETISSFREMFFEAHGSLPIVSIALQVNCSSSEQTIKKFKNEMSSKSWENDHKAICGKPPEVSERIVEIAHTLRVNEVVLMNAYHNLEEKSESILLIAESLLKKRI